MPSYMMNHLASMDDHHFTELAPGIGTGRAPDVSWQPLSNVPLVILVGVTGVGKSTTLHTLRDQGFPFQLLPDRRELTDQLIIAFLQRQAGEAPHPVTDRTERFALTRRYREQFPGGMSHALSQLLIIPQPSTPSSLTLSTTATAEAEGENAAQAWYFFDGLRGVDELLAAVELLPFARFIVLDAPDVVRVERLLGRGDRFDQVTLQPVAAFAKRAGQELDQAERDGTVQTFTAIGVPEADGLFATNDRATLFALCKPPLGQGDITIDDLRAKLKIVAEERRNYDPSAALQTLQRIAPHRTLVINTTQLNPTAAADWIGEWLQQQRTVKNLM